MTVPATAVVPGPVRVNAVAGDASVEQLLDTPVAGQAIPTFEEFWFSRGGFSMQANLLDGPLPEEIQSYIVFTGAVSADTPTQQAARDLIAFLKSPVGAMGCNTLDEARPT